MEKKPEGTAKYSESYSDDFALPYLEEIPSFGKPFPTVGHTPQRDPVIFLFGSLDLNAGGNHLTFDIIFTMCPHFNTVCLISSL